MNFLVRGFEEFEFVIEVMQYTLNNKINCEWNLYLAVDLMAVITE
jgi:hypothetical protein